MWGPSYWKGDSSRLLDQCERIHEGQLSWWRWLAQTGHRTPQISGVIDQGAKRPVCSIETDTGVRSRVDTCKRRYRV